MHYLAPPKFIAVFLVATILVMTAALGVVMTLLLMNQKRNKVYRNSLEALRQQHANELLRSQIEIQEMTFKHVSLEIHDNISLSLTLAKLTLHQLTEIPEVSDMAENAQQLITGAIMDLRAISRGLNADMIHQQGLANAIQTEIERIRRTRPMQIDFEVIGAAELPPALELLLFRTTQECFNNILKYANAHRVALQLTLGEDRVVLEVTDDGIGFDLDEVASRKGKSTGLHTLRSRARLVTGTLTIESTPGAGTRLRFDLPIVDPNEKEQNFQSRPGGRPRPDPESAP